MGNVFGCELDSYKPHSEQVLAMLGSKDLGLGTFVLAGMAVGMALRMALGDMFLAHTLGRMVLSKIHCLAQIQQ